MADVTGEPTCPNCGGTHYGSVWCPYAVPYDADDPDGRRRGREETCRTVNIRDGTRRDAHEEVVWPKIRPLRDLEAENATLRRQLAEQATALRTAEDRATAALDVVKRIRDDILRTAKIAGATQRDADALLATPDAQAALRRREATDVHRLAAAIYNYECDAPHHKGGDDEQHYDTKTWVELEPWLHIEHEGDCVNACATCRRCVVEACLHEAQWIAAALDDAPARGTEGTE